MDADTTSHRATAPAVRWRSAARRALESVPVFGGALYRLYLRASQGEGRVIVIHEGPLAGLKLRRAREITPVLPDLISGGYEVECLERLGQALQPGYVMYDVGAHAGLYAMFGARLVGPSGRVVAVEAHPGNAAHVRGGLALNQISNCTVVCAAISDRVGQSHLFDSGNSSMFQLAEVSSTAVQRGLAVETTTLEHLARRYGDPDVIKIDIEGAEALALRGAEPLLRRKRPVLLIEVHTAELANEVHPFLHEIGYQITTLNGEEVPDSSWHRFILAR